MSRAAELDPLEPRPALRPRRRAAEERDGALERGPLGRDGARVVARVGLLLVRGVVLLVDADQAEVARPARRRPSARRRRRAPRRRGCARARRGGPRRSAPSAAARPRRRSARGSGRRSAGSRRSRARARSPRGRARARPRTPGGRPRSCRCRSRRGAGTSRRPRPRPATTRARAARCEPVSSAGSRSPGSACTSAAAGCSLRRFGHASARRARALAPASSRSSGRARAPGRRVRAAARRRPARPGATSTPGGASTPTSTTTRGVWPGRSEISTTAPVSTPSGTSYVNSCRAHER